VRWRAILLIAALSLAPPVSAQDQPCTGADLGITDEDLSSAELAFVAKRFLLVCHLRSSDQTLRELRLFSKPSLDSKVEPVGLVRHVDMFVDQLVTGDGEQFLGGKVMTPKRCPLVQFVLPDGTGGTTVVDRWYMLSTDLDCSLKQPGEQ